MLFLIVGVVLAVLKYLEVGFAASLSWYVVLIPFGLTLLWWAWADATGYTKRKAMEKMEKRKRERQERQQESLGTGIKRKR